jgi:methyl-accepting chemotaxis protein
MHLRSCLALVLCGTLTIASGLFFSVSWWITDQIVADNLERRLTDEATRLDGDIAAQTQRGRTVVQLISHIPSVVGAFAASDRARLAADMVPAFEALRTEGIDQIQFHTAPATSFLRANQPGKFGDDLSSFRHTVVAANRNGQMSAGLEAGVTGTSIRVVTPVRQGERAIGSMEVGLSFGQPFARTFTERSGSWIAVYLDQGGQTARAASTFPEGFAPTPEQLATAHRGAFTEPSATIGASSRALRFAPLKDYSGAVVGVTVIGVDRADLDTMWRHALWLFAGIAAAVLAIGLAAAALLDAILARPLGQLTQSMNVLVDGGTQVTLPHTVRVAEVADLLRAVTAFRDTSLERARLEEENRHEVEARKKQNQGFSDALEMFHNSAEQVLKVVEITAGQLRNTAEGLAATAADVSRQASSASASSHETSSNVQTVAAAAEELSGSIQEIDRQVESAASVIERAGAITERSAAEIETLAEAGQKIGDVVSLIQAIASQTNLLALNATIEAARAGDAGRGFAVVASEVKNLASQTAKATDDIAHQISAIQASTRSAVDSIREVARAMTDIQAATSSITTAVQQQSAATTEISRGAQQAATGTTQLAENISGVTNAVEHASHSAAAVLKASTQLSEESAHLTAEVKSFIHMLRTGPLDRRHNTDRAYAGPERRQRAG